MSARSGHRRRAQGDEGAVLVEAAFALPVLLFVLLAFVDFSFWEFQNSQASSAARDGARVGILLPLDATATKSKAQNQADTKAAITTAVRARIPGASKLNNFRVDVWCEGGTKGVDFSGCDNPTPGTTRLMVAASWRYLPMSPMGAVFGKPTVSSTAGMIYVGVRTPSGTAPPTLCEVQTQAPTVPELSGSTLAGNMTLDFTTNGAADCTGWSVTLLDPDGNSKGAGSVDPFAGVATITPSQVSGLSPGPYVIRLATSTREWMVDVTLNAPADCQVTLGAPTVPRLSGSTLTGNLTLPFTTNGAANCTNWTATLLDSNSVSKGTGTVDGTTNVATFTPGQVPGLSAGTYTIRLSNGINNWTVNVGLSPQCAVTVSAVPATATARSNGNLSTSVTATVTANSGCSGSLTVQLVRLTASNLFQVYQTKTIAVSTSATNVSYSGAKQDLDSNGPKSYTAGTYRVYVSGGGLPAAGVFSNDVVVS